MNKSLFSRFLTFLALTISVSIATMIMAIGISTFLPSKPSTNFYSYAICNSDPIKSCLLIRYNKTYVSLLFDDTRTVIESEGRNLNFNDDLNEFGTSVQKLRKARGTNWYTGKIRLSDGKTVFKPNDKSLIGFKNDANADPIFTKEATTIRFDEVIKFINDNKNSE
jgi:hypothetical protein